MGFDPFTPPLAVVFRVLRIPDLRLKVPRFARPEPMTLCAILTISYYLVSSGIVYDLVTKPPGIGQAQDPLTGAIRSVPFLPNRINSQYIIEGLSAGFLFTVGGCSVILLHWANDITLRSRNRWLLHLSGFVGCVISYNMCMLFFKIKVPGYMKT
mmetsp:Transcript_9490/g.19654  ORF Transcript_9490/g.19654 Transcript_9490/m.19654 type:complete len:155 (+) Transcript_9490:137-601(+)